ncbi:N-acetyltransferase [Helicobacter sp. 13S00477-4]|uniref:GNAT family N-acetyltransferase n=1 Tax=Helicobacter sp. 13S00477-4 TaxID=1905759 RepID=UPI000BA6BBC2|nr:N-acetyltransferase [Helicobacter sp. 13S00477-4]PAF52684.1 hypothetical protein BKH44_00425 [Helicobacter sp. 13S00477-4]
MIDFKLALRDKELENIYTLAQSIWKENYAHILSIEQIQYMLERFQSVLAIQDQIKKGYKYFQIFNCSDTAGYFAFTQKDDRDFTQKGLFLSKLYILKDYRSQGIAKLIIAYLKGIAYMLNTNFIWLTVNKHNQNAIQAYQKLGFKIYREDRVDIGEGYVMDDYYMKLNTDFTYLSQN